MKEKISIVDPTSRSLPYDFFYISSLANTYEIDFYCGSTKYNEQFIHALESVDSVNVLYFDNGSSLFKRLFSYLQLFYTLFMRKNKYIKINVQWLVFPYLEIFFYFIFKSKVVFTLHNERPHWKSDRSPYFPFKLINWLSFKIIFVSLAVKNSFLDTYGRKNIANCFLLNHGELPISIKSERPDIYRGNSLELIIFWGTVKDYKGVDFLAGSLDIFAEAGLNLEIHGKFDNNLLKLKTHLLNNNIKVVDEYLSESQVVSLLQQKKAALILPYKNATQSGVMYTSLFYGMPFLASNSGDNSEFLKENNLSELLFEYGDKNSLRLALNFLSQNYPQTVSNLKSTRGSYNWEYDSSLLSKIFEEENNG